MATPLPIVQPEPRPAVVPKDPVTAPPVSNRLIAVVMLLVTETMFFTGLIGAYIFLRGGNPEWEPMNPAQRLPLAITLANTLVLTASAVTMLLAVRVAKRAQRSATVGYLTATVGLGLAFLLVQGSEWSRLLAHGLTASSSLYGGTFYLLIGTHGLHVLFGVFWLLATVVRARRGELDDSGEMVLRCSLYWLFVTGLWYALFGLVYQ